MAPPPRDRDYVETVEGLFFCVVGYLHPPGMYTAYLKYAPGGGPWKRGRTKYSRVIRYYHVLEVGRTIELLKEKYPHYVYYCPVRGIEISMVPESYVARYYRPGEGLREIEQRGPGDRLEEELVLLVDWLEERGVDRESLGVTGSLLLGIHNPEISDIDLVVYGTSEAERAREVLVEASGEGGLVRKLPREYVEEWCARRARQLGLEPEYVRRIAERRWNYGMLSSGRYFSVHPVRREDEIEERYGERVYRKVGVVEGEATVADSSESMFLPAVYKLENVEVSSGPEAEDILELVSYEGLFSGIASEGERVKFRGKLERVLGRRRREYHRVLIGSTEVGTGYLVPL